MNLFKSSLIAAAVLAALPLAARAESGFSNGPGKLTAKADLDFEVKIPQILMLQVGAANGISKVTFDLSGTPKAVGNGTPVAGVSNDTGGKVTAKLRGNVGNVSLGATTTGPLSNAAGDTISFSKITAASSVTGFAPPALADAKTNTVTITAGSNKVIDQTADWTYSYANDEIVAPGTYGGDNVGNSRVTYTAAMP